MARKITLYNIQKGLKYLKHFGFREFMIRLHDRMEPEEVPYGPWYQSYVPTEAELNAQRSRRWKDPVTFSICVPLYNTPEKLLREMIESVLAQTYHHWELCLADAGTDEKTFETASEYAAKDSRILLKKLGRNGGISGNTNAAAAMASGDFISLLDHDDLLSPAALWECALYVSGHPDTQMLYTDEDKTDFEGREHFQPNLKPDFNPDLLCSNNYITHFLSIRRDLWDRLGGLDQAYDGAQDHDLVLRAADELRAEYGTFALSAEQGENRWGPAVPRESAADPSAWQGKIGHVPEILYHWRTGASSTADNPMSKLYAYDSGKRAIEAHLLRTGVHGEVSLRKDFGFYRVRYPVDGSEKVSVIIPNRNEKETLEKCIRSILEKSTYRNYEIIIVENNSDDPEIFDYYRKISSPQIRVIAWKGVFNYSAINNFAVRHSAGSYLLFLNNDTEVITPDWIEELLGMCRRPDTGAVGAKLYYPNDTIQSAGIVIGIGGTAGVAGSMFVDMKRDHPGYLNKACLQQDLSAVTAACVMIRRSVFEEVAGFDEKLTVAFNDVDLCLRIRQKGYLIAFNPYAELYHYESKSRGTEDNEEKVRRFQTEIELMRTRWEKLLKDGDPYYNKNLSLTKWNYSLRTGAHMR